MRKAWGILLLLPLAGALYALWSQPVQLWGRPEKNVTWELAQAPPERLQEVYTRAHPAVLRIDGPEGSRGTGFFYREGLVLTAYHVVAEGGPYTLVLSNQKRATATLLGFAEPMDLAILATEARAPALLSLETQRRPQVGEAVLHIGNGRNQFIAPRYGRITRLFVDPSPFLPQGLVGTSLPLSPGDSGGPGAVEGLHREEPHLGPDPAQRPRPRGEGMTLGSPHPKGRGFRRKELPSAFSAPPAPPAAPSTG
ncbi:S1 family peptidase [Thermus scotoductus]|uniref:S1 family peptidase n=1 Tax=Thermus scotoductus TaxID=37636 RepID=UPI000F8120E6|nr:hypothetical protein CSW42_03475 [Thermus scotoductus]